MAFNLDKVMHTVGLSAMALWLKVAIHIERGKEILVCLRKEKAEEDIQADNRRVGEVDLKAI